MAVKKKMPGSKRTKRALRRSKPQKRKESNIQIKERILIVCEGEKTEPNYFESLRMKYRLSSSIVIKGEGANTQSLVRIAIEESKKLGKGYRFDSVWCVFDKDSFEESACREAFELADSNKINVIFSNEAFEFWYLLHFDYIDSAMSRGDYGEKLTQRLGEKYEKNDKHILEKIERVNSTGQNEAIRNAKRLILSHKSKDDQFNPITHPPYTNVHELVLKLSSMSSDL